MITEGKTRGGRAPKKYDKESDCPPPPIEPCRIMFSGLTIKEAEDIAGLRLDRRRKYYMHLGNLCVSKRCLSLCQRCSDFGSSGFVLGCRECGYTGKRRVVILVPIKHFKKYSGKLGKECV